MLFILSNTLLNYILLLWTGLREKNIVRSALLIKPKNLNRNISRRKKQLNYPPKKQQKNLRKSSIPGKGKNTLKNLNWPTVKAQKLGLNAWFVLRESEIEIQSGRVVTAVFSFIFGVSSNGSEKQTIKSIKTVNLSLTGNAFNANLPILSPCLNIFVIVENKKTLNFKEI